MGRFCYRLKTASFHLNNSRCIAKYSFVVLKSVSYLDLSLCELSTLRGKSRNAMCASYYSSSISITVASNFVCTEEGCKKDLAPNRKILYDHHLDVSSGLELRFGNNRTLQNIRYNSDRVLLNRLGIDGSYWRWCLQSMADCLLFHTPEKVKFLHKISKAAQRISFISRYGYIRSEGSNILFSDNWDSNIVKDYLMAMDFEDGFLMRLRPGVVEYLLYHASCAGYSLKDHPRLDLINYAIYQRKFQYVPPLLRYRDAPKFCESTYLDMAETLIKDGFYRESPIKNLSPVRNALQTEERNSLLLQIFYVFFFERESGLKALQLVWRSVSQPLISLDELVASYPELYGTEFLEKIRNFLCDVTGEETFHPEPRKLKHFCRTAVRNALSSNTKLSSRIDDIGVPPSMLSFLKLEQ